MPRNLLQIVQTACDELGLPRPAVVAGATDLQVRQLFALINRDVRELQQNYDWTALQSEYDLYVAPPIPLIGNVVQGTNVVSDVNAILGDYNSIDYNTDYLLGNRLLVSSGASNGDDSFNASFNQSFGGVFPGTTPLGPIPGVIVANPSLFVINGQNIPVGARILAAQDASTLQISEVSTATQQNVILWASQDTYPGPPDFDRYINQTWWDRTNRWALMGPDSPVVDQWHRSGVVTVGPRRHFRQIGYNGLIAAGGALNNYRLWPPPGSTDTPIQLVFEYISSCPVVGINGNTLTPQQYFQADTDIPVIDDNMVLLGAKWRMWQIKGFDAAPFQSEWQEYVDRKYANDGGAKTLSLPSPRASFYLNPGQVQDGNFPGPGNTSGI